MSQEQEPEIIDATYEPQPVPQAPPAEVIEAAAALSRPREPAPWFGYIGLAIAVVSMLIGLAGLVVGVIYFIGWTRS